MADQSHYYSYKWADITEPHGTIDQDRFAGIRGIDGTYPDVVAITSRRPMTSDSSKSAYV